MEEQLKQLIEGMGQIQDRLGGLEQTQELLAGKVNEIETVKITGASTQVFSGQPAQGLKDYEKDLGLQPTPTKGRGSKSYLSQQHEAFIKQEPEDGQMDSDGEDNITEMIRAASAKYTAVIKSNVEKHSGKEEDHGKWLATLRSEFQLNGFSAIIDDKESVWINYRKSKPNKAKLQERVMISILNGTVKIGQVYTKFQSARTLRPLDGRGMYIAVKETFHSVGYRASRRKINRKLAKLQFDEEEGYSVFKLLFTEIMNDYSSLNNRLGEPCEMPLEMQVDKLLEKFQEEEGGLPMQERTKWITIFTNLEAGLGPDEDLQVEDVHNRIEKEFEAHADTEIRDNHRGRMNAQQLKRLHAALKCALCGDKHLTRNCPNKED